MGFKYITEGIERRRIDGDNDAIGGRCQVSILSFLPSEESLILSGETNSKIAITYYDERLALYHIKGITVFKAYRSEDKTIVFLPIMKH